MTDQQGLSNIMSKLAESRRVGRTTELDNLKFDICFELPSRNGRDDPLFQETIRNRQR